MIRRVDSGLSTLTIKYLKEMLLNSTLKDSDIEQLQTKLDECLNILNLEEEKGNQEFIDLFEVYQMASSLD